MGWQCSLNSPRSVHARQQRGQVAAAFLGFVEGSKGSLLVFDMGRQQTHNAEQDTGGQWLKASQHSWTCLEIWAAARSVLDLDCQQHCKCNRALLSLGISITQLGKDMWHKWSHIWSLFGVTFQRGGKPSTHLMIIYPTEKWGFFLFFSFF